jgi:hypothetical protein
MTGGGGVAAAPFSMMRLGPHQMSRSRMTAVFALAISVLTPAGMLAQAAVESPNDPPVLVLPTRRALDAAPTAPPDVAKQGRIAPTTLLVTVTRRPHTGPVRAIRRTVSRTTEQIHIAETGGREWLFERNPIDARRVAATSVDHRARTIIHYEETDLRIALGIRGWADVLSLGFDPATLTGYIRTADQRTLGPVHFVRYTANGRTAAVPDIWWSDEQLLASRFGVGDPQAEARLEIARATAGVDPSVLQPAASRFPTYKVVSLADWLEKH